MDEENYCRVDSFLPGLRDDVALMCLARVSRSDYIYLSCLNIRFNKLIQSGYLYELRMQLGIVEHWVYMSCDIRGWETFHPFAKIWMRLPLIPCDECFQFSYKESLAVGSELHVFGRELFGFVIWKYSLISQNWVKGKNMNHPRTLFASATLGSIAIVAGGCDQLGKVLKSAELYDSLKDEWVSLPSMHSPRRLCSGFFMDGKYYVISGINSLTTNSLTCGEEFDLKTRKWRKIENMYPDMYPDVTRAAQPPPKVAVVDNELYALDHFASRISKYNKEKICWEELGRLPFTADSQNGWGLSFMSFGNSLLVVGSEKGPEGGAIMLNSLNPKSGVKNGILNSKVIGSREHSGAYLYDCAVMGC